MTPPARILLVDASPYIFRAFHSLPESIVDRDGRPVGAIHGFVSFLLQLLERQEPSHLGVAFDHSLTTSFRNDIDPGYKAHREEPPAALVAQLDDCREATAALGAATFLAEGYEADDLIGTLTHPLAATGHRILVVTSDKDLAQLVGERVALLDWAAETLYGEAEVRAKFGVEPHQIPDYLGLVGDRVDNIPGVAGVGAKTAAALLAALGDLDGLYAGLDRVAELPLRGAAGIRSRLEAGREAAFLSRRLATIARDAPVAADLGALRYRGADRARVAALFARLGFRTLGDRIRHWRDAT